MDLKLLSDDELIQITRADIECEREATIKVLNDILEIDRRKLFLKKNCDSLCQFIMDLFGFSGYEAQTRIQAMRLMRAVPEVEEKLSEGTLNLTNASKCQSFFYQEEKKDKEYSHSEKLRIVEDLENRSTRDCEKLLFRLSPPDLKTKEKIKQVSEHLTHFEFNAGEDFVNDLDEFKNLVSHELEQGNLAEIFGKILKLALEAKRRKSPTKQTRTCAPNNTKSRYVPAQIKREVFQEAEHQCEYVDLETGKRCCSKYKLEIDHIKPFSHGGETVKENLRVLCKKHNIYRAFQDLGEDVMGGYYKQGA